MIPLHKDIILDHEYHVVEVDAITTGVIVWMVEKFGPVGKRWWHHNNKIYFRDEKDWMWFELST